jgi:hypothetical protein
MSKDGFAFQCKSCNKNWIDIHKEEKAIYQKDYRETHKEEKKSYEKVYRETNKEKITAYRKNYRITHRKEVTTCRKKYQKKRRQTDPQFKIASNLRTRLWNALNDNQKIGSAVKDLGCSVEELKIYLESKFYPNLITGETMSWSNYGIQGWHIDHIRPLVSFDLTDIKEFLDACNYKNLQPLWAKENLSKGDKQEELQ